MNYSWNWSILTQPPYLGWLVSGLELTLVISISAWILALIAGTLVGVLGTLPYRIPRQLAATYVGLFRNIPLLLQLFLWFFVVPNCCPADGAFG